MTRTHTLIALALALTSAVPGWAQTKEGPWMVRARAVNIQSANSDGTGLGLGINNKTFLEFDISYSLSKTLALELILAAPQEHTLTANGETIGSVAHLPPTILLQYRLGGKTFKPYVGAGLNYTAFTSVSAPPGITITRSSTGLAFQAGFDVPLGKSVYANLDVKKIFIGTTVSSAGTPLGEFKIDPWLIGVGFGYRF